jgi:predicted nucleotidyltransferase
MSGNPVDHLPLGEIRGLCRKFGVNELAIFGSALGEEFDADSDLDFLVRFRSGAEKPWMGHFQELERELSRLLGRYVDLVDRKAVEQSRNWIRREAILESARTILPTEE